MPSALGARTLQSTQAVRPALPSGLRQIKSLRFKGAKPKISKQSRGSTNSASTSSNDTELVVLAMNDPKGDRAAFIKQLMASGEVEYAEPDSVMRASVLPNDPSFSLMWGLNNTGQSAGTVDVDIDAPEAWDGFTTGSASVVVGVVDTGIRYNHPDLIGNIWQNPGETGLDINGLDKATNLIDDDLNGYVDDVHGIDCINNDSDPLDDDTSDYHGTHVAGTIGAQGNNANQVTGVNWNVSLMALKYLGANGTGVTSDAVECLSYVANMKADKGINIRVTNNSYGGSSFSQAMLDAIQATEDQGILFVAAAGNDAEDSDSLAQYPSSYDLPSIVSVASIDRNANLAGTSNYGLESVDIGAPGVSILSTSSASGVDTLSGTSMASPHVAGVAALLSAHDANLAWQQVKGRMLDTAVSAPSLQGRTVTGGYVNAFDALNCSVVSGETKLYFEPNSVSEYIRTGGVLDFDVGLSNCGEAVLSETVTLSFDSGEASLSLLDNGVAPDSTAGDGRYTAAWSPSIPGPVQITITAGSLTRTLNRVVVDVPSYEIDPAHPYSWVESSDGIDIGLNNVDDEAALVPIGFDFEFYGIAHNTLYAHSNGMLKFGGDVELSFFEFLDLPSSVVPNNFISVLWEDLNPSVNSGRIFSKLQGTAPNRRLIIQWHDLLHFKQESEELPGRVTFQAVLYEGSNDIVLQYQDLTFGSPDYDFAARAMIGIEAFDGSEGITFLNQGQPVETQLAEQQAIRFSISGSTQRTLLVDGSNNGTISDDLLQVNCGELNASCFGQYSVDTDVVLTATPASGYQFDAWTGADCDLELSNSCTVSMNAHQAITAQFSLAPAVLVTGDNLVTDEAGLSAQFSVVLSTTPSHNVEISILSSDTTEANVSSNQLIFTPSDALVEKTIIVTGLDDDLVDGDVSYTLSLQAAVSDDVLYAGLDPRDVSASNTDLDLDSDVDGKVDDVDNCPNDYNPAQMNSDFANDGGDVCDDDDDNDAVLDVDDNCTLDFNPAQKDTDGDTQGDSCDPDSDNDSIFDSDDDDPVDPKICQDLDMDGCNDCSVGTDGFGELSDADPHNDGPDLDGDFICDMGDPDIDGDGVANNEDNCIRVANPDQQDSDGDEQGDACLGSDEFLSELCVPIKTSNDKVVVLCL
jgi:subtilisin family serine protease